MTAETLPDSIGPYKVVGLLGKGGMGSVYKAYKPPLNQRFVAVKTIRAEFLSTPDALKRFRREAELSSQLKHPNIVTVYDYEEVSGGDSYIVTEIIEGGITLRDRMQTGSLSLSEVASIITQVASALDYAYESHNIVHRDIKPSNIFFEHGKRIALGDFGIAKDVSRNTQLTSLGEGVGTPDYMSPEQAMGDPLDRRSDIYSLGIVLFEMLTGTLPFKGDTPISVVMGHIQKPVPQLRGINPDIPQTVESVVTKSLQKKRENRFSTAGELAKALDGAISSSAVDGATISVTAPPRSNTGTLGFGEPPANPLVTQELNVVDALEATGRYQDAFDRLYTLRTQYPAANNVSQRYQFYINQGYGPSSSVSGTGNFYSNSGATAGGVRTGTPPPSQYTQQPTNFNNGSGYVVTPKPAKSPLPLIIGGVAVILIVGGIILAIVLSSGNKGTTQGAATATVAATTTTIAATTVPVTTAVPTTTVDTSVARAKSVNKEGDDFFDRGNFTAAIEKYKEAVRLSSGTGIYHANLARAYVQTQDFSLAENEARLAISLDSTDASFQFILGTALSGLSRKLDASKAYGEATRLKPEVPIYHTNLADVLLDLNKPADSETEARKALALFSNTSQDKDYTKNVAFTQSVLGEALQFQQKYVESEAAFREALKLVPNSAVYQLDISKVIFDNARDLSDQGKPEATKKFTDSEAEARKAISLDSNYAEAHNQLGLCLEFQDKPTDALPSYRKAVELAPKVAAYQRNLAGILIELKNYLEAETVSQTAVQLDNTSSRAYNLLGVAQYEQNKYDASIPNYQKAIDLSQSRPQAVYFRNIGLAYEAVKNYQKAREAYQKAFDLGTTSYKTTVQGDLDRIKGK